MAGAKRISAAEKKENLERLRLIDQLAAFEISCDSDGEDLNNEVTDNSVVQPPIPEKSKYNPDSIVDVVTFAEHPYYCGMTLHPWQKLVLKLFYMGTEGNQNLTIEKDRQEKKCKGCVWNYSKKTELESIDSFKRGDLIVKKGLLPEENSPCLTCKRFGKESHKIKFEALKSQATSLSEENKYDRLEKQGLLDNYCTEYELLDNPDFNQEIRKQVENKLGNKFQELVLVVGRRGSKAVSVETPILTTEGWSTMGEIKVGDYVFAPDGLPTKVTAKSDVNYTDLAYEMYFSNGEVIIASEGHQWRTLTKAQRKNASRGKHSKSPVSQIFTTEEIYNSLTYGKPRQMLKKGSKTERNEHFTTEFNHAIEITKPLIYSEQQLDMHPYLCGIFLSYGSKSTNVISGIDLELFDYIQSNCQHIVNHSEKVRAAHYLQKHIITGKPFVQILKEENLYNNKHIPRKYLESSIEQRMELLRGLLDGDGHASRHNGAVHFTNTNKQLIDNVYELVCGLGFKATIKERDAKLYGRFISKVWQISFSVRPGTKIFNLSRKQEIVDNAIKTVDKSDKYRVFIKNCVLVKNPGVQCIEVDHHSHMYLCGKSLIPTHNSFLTTICSLYEAYRLLEMKNPHKRYGLIETEPIGILNVAASREQAENAIFAKIKSMVYGSPYFTQKLGNPATVTEIFLLTEQNIQDNKKRVLSGLPPIPGGIILRCGHSNSSSMVGGTNWCVLIDEVAAMDTADGSMVVGVDYKLYEDLAPTRATFGSDGKIFILSQPKGTKGLLYDLYNNRKITPSTLVLQLPTWVINPSISQDFLDEEKDKNFKTFAMQYGAVFGASESEFWIDYELVENAFFYKTPRIEQATDPQFSYFCHIDPSNSVDYYTIVVAHTVPSMRPDDTPDVFIDHIHYWKPTSAKPINTEMVEDYVINLHKKFRFKQVSYDHWNSQSSITKLQNQGINAVCRQFSKQYKDQIYGELYQLFVQNKIFIYTYNTTVIDEITKGPRDLNEIDVTKSQFKTLQRKFNGKNYKIEAMAGAYDDIPDAIAAAAYEALSAKMFVKPLPRPITVYTP